MKRKYLTSTIALALIVPLLFSILIPTATGLTYGYDYSDAISVGESFEWTIKTFDWSGDDYAYYFAENVYIGDVNLVEDFIKGKKL